MSISTYLEKFQNNLGVVEHTVGAIDNMPGIIKFLIKDTLGNVEPIEEDKKYVLDKHHPGARQHQSFHID